ncbi:MAG: hypothetical protein ACYSWP_15980 [Planctomycetota bacterium]
MGDSDILISIPVVIDDVKQLGTFQMTRCSYFSIECDTPSPEWFLGIGESLRMPFLMLGLSGIIYQPMDGGEHFDSPEELEKLFGIIEDRDDLYIDVNDIWLPNELFKNDKINHKRGKVYRVGLDLFKTAYRFQKDSFDQGFIKSLMEFGHELSYCAGETKVLSKWNKDRIKESSDYYREHPELQLPRKKGKGKGREMEGEG